MISRRLKALSVSCVIGAATLGLAGPASAQQAPQPGVPNDVAAADWAKQFRQIEQERAQLEIGDQPDWAQKPDTTGRPDWAQRPDHAVKPEWDNTPGHRSRPDWARMPDHAEQQNQAAASSGGLGPNFGATSSFGGPQANTDSFRSHSGGSNRRR